MQEAPQKSSLFGSIQDQINQFRNRQQSLHEKDSRFSQQKPVAEPVPKNRLFDFRINLDEDIRSRNVEKT